MSSQRILLVRHGEVENPGGVLYERLDGFGLSERGHRMAALAADDIAGAGLREPLLITSPLQRTRESAAPIAAALGVQPDADERVIEPWNRFAGKRMRGGAAAWKQPRAWRYLVNPLKPSWGEPYRQIANRMLEAMRDAADRAEGRDVIVVTHQLPIWMVHRHLDGKPLVHNPTTRRCALSSITEFETVGDTGFAEVDYREPAAAELHDATDQGAV